jgi:hypothetical protein
MIPSVRAWPAFVALLTGMAAIAAVSFGAPTVAYLWYNVIGAVVVVAVGVLLSAIGGRHTAA